MVRQRGSRAFAALFLLLLGVGTASAQHLHTELVISGLHRPVAFVQDPSQPNVQFVVEQRGRIRPVVNGQLQSEDFLDLTGIVSENNEGGLLGMAFAPDYASSGRFYVNFTDMSDNTVVARFTRAGGDALRANPDSRFDLVWPDRNASIAMPYCCHYGGHLAFGPDGYLYIALGDGGAWDDPDGHAQNPQSLLGKMLRIDVGVPDDDPRGYAVPSSNPFVDREGVLPEIWSVGLRNPWRYTFDDPARGGTGALVISDVGQYGYEEFDYEPAGAAGRNYGWRNREGAHPYVETTAPWFEPLTDPTFEYDHTSGRCIIGGYIYRGTALGSSFTGRYFFGDFVSGQLWSIALNIDPATGEATPGELWEHTSEVSTRALNLFSSFGVDANGELYVVSWFDGSIHRLVNGPPPPPVSPTEVLLDVDSPAAGSSVAQPFDVSGWALDRRAETSSGIDYVEIWARLRDGSSSARLIGRAVAVNRPDVAALFGAQFAHAGYTLSVRGLAAGSHEITVFAHSATTHAFEAQSAVIVDVGSAVRIAIDQPSAGPLTARRLTVSGWTLDASASIGTGIDAVHVWAFPRDGRAPIWVGVAEYSRARGDVAAVFGSQFNAAGFHLSVPMLPVGTYILMVYARSSVDGRFAGQGVEIDVRPPSSDPAMAVDIPAAESTQAAGFTIAGWAIDRGAESGTGVDAVHVWAFPVDSGLPPAFLGAATLGLARRDVGNIFGDQFAASGLQLSVAALPSGRYQVGVYARSSVSGAFNQVRFLLVVVP